MPNLERWKSENIFIYYLFYFNFLTNNVTFCIYIYRWFTKSWECEDNTDPEGFALLRNGACLSRDYFGDDADIPAIVQSISTNCMGMFLNSF